MTPLHSNTSIKMGKINMLAWMEQFHPEIPPWLNRTMWVTQDISHSDLSFGHLLWVDLEREWGREGASRALGTLLSDGVYETRWLCPPSDLVEMAIEMMGVFVCVLITLGWPCGQTLIYPPLRKANRQRFFAVFSSAKCASLEKDPSSRRHV